MRIVYVSTDAGAAPFGHKGASVHVQAIVAQLLDRGHEVHLVTPRPGPVPAHLAGLRVHPIPGPQGSDPASRERAARETDRQTASVLDELAAVDRIDLVYERYALWGRTTMAWARRHGVASVLEVNSPLPIEQARHRSLVDRAGADAVARSATSDAEVVVCVSEPVAAWVRRLGAAAAVHVVPNGVDTRRFEPAVVRPRPDVFTVGFVGTLKPWHGVADLVRAMALLCDGDRSYRLLLVGEGPERPRLEELVLRHGLADAVEFTGATAPQDVPAQLARMDVAVAPYPPADAEDFYFSPLKIYEYLAAGLPVVASDVGTVADLLTPNGTPIGMLYPAGSVRGLAAALAGLREAPTRRAQLGVRGRRAAVDAHDWAHVLDRILDLSEVHHGASQAS